MIFYYQYISKQIPTDKHWNCQVLFLKVWHLTSYYRYVFMMTSLKKITGMNTFCTKSLKWLNTGQLRSHYEKYFFIRNQCSAFLSLTTLLAGRFQNLHGKLGQQAPSFGSILARTTDTQWRHKSNLSEKLGRCGRQNMRRLYLKIWDWDWILGRAVMAIPSLGVRSPWFEEQ